ncbi:OLC1v1036148C1 [Oldenlandia corymbosa var. corymbosa]|uniref:OLC1v1036148C1 n=1 Tax=Oldenlandia corymbosa var. corymbosa TaxID=529605 RepID=A0AAV1CXT6_OLDCO|nr:OLC1v1036148C1 [Oldenlandia corymbosa var. corymbosa]
MRNMSTSMIMFQTKCHQKVHNTSSLNWDVSWADFTLENFQSQHNDLKDAIIKNASVGFEYEDGDLARECITKQLISQFKNYKHKLHKFYKEHGSKEEALMNVPTGMDAHNWDEICNKFDSDSYKKLCTRNKANCAHLTIANANGTKSIARMIEEMKRNENEDVDSIGAYKLGHYNMKKGAWVSEAAEKKQAELIRVKDATGKTPAAICEQVLKGIPGQARGRSVPKKRVIALEKSRYEIEKEKERANEPERSRDLLAEEVAASKEEYKKLEELQRLFDESVAAMQRKLDKLMEFMPSQNVSF